MGRIPPSQLIREELSELLERGASGEGDILNALILKSAQRVIQEELEEEVADFLGRGHYERGKGARGLAIGMATRAKA